MCDLNAIIAVLTSMTKSVWWSFWNSSKSSDISALSSFIRLKEKGAGLVLVLEGDQIRSESELSCISHVHRPGRTARSETRPQKTVTITMAENIKVHTEGCAQVLHAESRTCGADKYWINLCHSVERLCSFYACINVNVYYIQCAGYVLSVTV